MPESRRVGVYVCHCGLNIAAGIDVAAVAAAAATLRGVVIVREDKYACSAPSLEVLQRDIREHRLDRIVIAACTPLLHQETFRRAAEQAGLNPFCLQIANIREQAAWVHRDRAQATRKAQDLLRGAVERVLIQGPLVKRRVPIHPDVLVVGAGIAGIHTSLTLANAGKHVYLVEREPTIGGNMARYDKTFPTLECAACILAPKMTAVLNHPNITLWTYSDVARVDGSVGNYRVAVRRRARFVHESLCAGCLACVDACSYDGPPIPDEFGGGLSTRKPVYLPFALAAPRTVTIDPTTCLAFTDDRCGRACVGACREGGAIDLDQADEIVTAEVGAIVVATGFKPFDAARAPEYGYGRYPNVYTSMEVERLVNAMGPTGGDIVLRDGRRPQSIGIIHCAGSRDDRYNRWCSRVCCATGLKLTHLLSEHTSAELFSFYIDMRAAGKAQEEFYQRVLAEGAHFIRGKVAEVCDWALDPSEEGKLVIRVEDTLTGFVRRVPVDMVVLVVGMEPQSDTQTLGRTLRLHTTADGFFLERHPKLAPGPTSTGGVFLAGCCQGPKDIPDTVMQAGYAAAEVLALSHLGYVEVDPTAATIDEEACSGCQLCMPLCPYSAIQSLPGQSKASVLPALCEGCGVCVAACPCGAIRQESFGDEQIMAEVEGVLAGAAQR